MKPDKTFFLFVLIILSIVVQAQSSAKQIRQGNKAFNEGNFQDAEILYRRALETDTRWEKEAFFNIGNSLYKQQKFEESAELFSKLSVNESLTDSEKAQVYHNLGNSFLMQEKYRESIDSYKKALRINPLDEDTRYNLSYAMKKMQIQQNQDQQNNQDQQDKQDQEEKQDQKDQQEQQDKDNQKDQKDNQQDKKDDDRKENKPQQQPQMSRQDMERMLNAISGKDRQTLEELRDKELQKGEYKPEKDW